MSAPVALVPSTPWPATIASGDSWKSGIMELRGNGLVTVALTASQAVSITIQRCQDAAGNIPAGAAVTKTTTANVADDCEINANSAPVAAGFFTVTVANSSGSDATIANPSIVIQGR